MFKNVTTDNMSICLYICEYYTECPKTEVCIHGVILNKNVIEHFYLKSIPAELREFKVDQ